MPTNVTLIDKRTAAKTLAAGAEINIGGTPGIVHVGVPRTQVEALTRQGNQLVVRLKTGEVFTVKDFFAADGKDPNDLVLDDEAGGFWHLDRNAPLDDPRFAHLQDLEPLLLTRSDTGAWLVGLGMGAIALAGGAGGGGGGGDSSQGPTVDASVNDAGTAVSGSTTPGATVQIRDQLGNVLAEGTADASGHFNVSLPAPLQPNQQVRVTVTDSAGNSASANLTYVDTLPPAAIDLAAVAAADDAGAVTGELHSGDTTDDTTPTFSGSGTPGDVVKLYDGDTVIGAAVVDASGHWVITPNQPLAEGTHQLSFTVTDASGNESAHSAVFELTVDTTAPSAPSVNPSDGTTISGTAEPGATVNIDTDGDGAPDVSVNVDENGQWSYTPEPPLEPGTPVTVTVTDAAGNTGTATSVTVSGTDNVAPEAPVITGVSDDVAAIVGAIGAGGLSNDARPTLSGTAEVGSTVTVFDNGVEIGSATADVTGHWTFTPTSDLGGGDHSFTAIATDAAGNDSVAGDAYAVTLDLTPPTAPSVDPSDGTIISGTAEPGETVSIDLDGDGSPDVSVLADATTGEWSHTPAEPLLPGTPVTVSVTDEAGNVSAATVTVSGTDTTAPDAPVIVGISDDVEATLGPVSNGGATNDSLPTLSGTAEVSSTVAIFDNGVEIGAALVDATGQWSFTPAIELDAGAHSFTAIATDAAGNASAPSPAFALTVDTTLPAVPVLASVSDDVGALQAVLTAGASTDDSRPTLAGTAELGSTVNVFDGAILLGTALADPVSGAWSFTPTAPLADGPHSLTVTATDAAGNVSMASPAFALTVDTVAPAAPTLNPTDGITLGGTAQPGATVAIDTNGDGTPEATVTADPVTGAWTFTPAAPLADGTVVSVTATDPAGNTGPAATVTVDTTPPPAPVIVSVTDDVGGVLGALLDGDETDDTLPVFSGTGEPGATITVLGNGLAIGTAPVDGAGNWTFTPTVALGTGAHSITATATDASGNVSAASPAFDLSIDTDAPAVTIAITGLTDDTQVADDWATDDTAPTVSGTLSAALGAGESVEISLDGGATWTTATVVGNAWFHGTDPLGVGSHPIVVRVVDAAGNVGNSASQTIDITAVADAPIVKAQAGSFLGLDVDVLNLIDTGNQMFVAYDPEGGLTNVRVAYDPALFGLGNETLTWSTELAAELGLTVTPNNVIHTVPIVGTQLTELSELTITKTGGTISNLEINELLKTVHLDSATVLGGAFLPTFRITATDVSGETHTDASASLLNAGLLNVFGNPSGDPTVIQGGDGSADALTGDTDNEHLYGYGGADTLNAGAGNDLLRGGAGADTLNGEAGNDLLIYDAGDTSIDGGADYDTLVLGNGGSITLNDSPGNVHNIEAINLGIDTAANTVTLTEQGVRNATTSGQLVISGDANDSVNMTGATFQGQVLIDGHAYDQYLLGTVTVRVEDPIPVVV